MSTFTSSAHSLRRTWLPVWLILVASSVALTLQVERDALPDEAPLVRGVQSWAIPGDAIADVVRAVTSTPFVVIAGVALAAVHCTAQQWRRSLTLAVLLGAMLLLQTGIKELVDRPRPSDVAAGIEARASQTSPSYPAGHVMGPTVVFGWALIILVSGRGVPKPLKASSSRSPGVQPGVEHRTVVHVGRRAIIGMLAGVLALTGLVNVYLGVHWPTDVIGGYLWGLVVLLPAVVFAFRPAQAV